METKLIQTSKGIAVYELQNDKGMRAQILTYGARIFKLFVPTASGDFVDVVAGFDTPEEFMGDNPYFNAVIGRYVNRIDSARFVLNDVVYELYANDGKHSLHGGKVGFDRRNWQVKKAKEGYLVLAYHSPAGEEGYPSDMDVTVTYWLDNDNSLHISYSATSDGPTPCNLTNHAYFHLGGTFDTIRNHVVWINSDYVTTSDEDLIAHGGKMAVASTPFDFGTPKELGRDIDADHVLLRNGKGGYDINYILKRSDVAATAYNPQSGVKMTVHTDCPCLQLYTGNFLDGTIEGKHRYGFQSAFCMETQEYPNAVNVPSFPSTILTPDMPYRRHTVYRFDVE